MAATDPWTGVIWNVYDGGPEVKPPNQIGQFSLIAVPDPVTGATAYYRVNLSGGNMPAPWNNLFLYPLGDNPVAPPTPPLPQWSSGTASQWTAAATTVLQGVTVSTARLVWDLPDTNLDALTIVRVDNATTQGAALIAIQLKNGGVLQPQAGGTGVGGGGP
jgi:hypothetical protein